MAAKSKGEPRYQVPRELADSIAFRSLPQCSKVLWHDLMMKYRGANNGNINCVLMEEYANGERPLCERSWRSPATLSKALKYLIAHGFVRETRPGGVRAGNLKQCCLYAFTHLPTHANQEKGIKGSEPTFDYRNFSHASHKAEKSLTLQKLKRVATNNEACRYNK